MKTFLINENDAGQRVDRFLEKSVPLLPKGLMQKYLRLKRIKRNGKRTAPADRLETGDQLQLYINDEFFPSQQKPLNFLKAGSMPEILYEDEHILLVNKPAGLIVHENDRMKEDSLIQRILRYLYEKGEYSPDKEASFTPALCNRIDQYTQGIVIAAKTAPALRILNQKLKEREIQKYYLCLVHGCPAKKEATLHGWLAKDGSSNTASILSSPAPGAKEISTAYRVVQPGRRYSLVEVELLTGRSHQIRAHMASIGHPLCGDSKYGADKLGKVPGLYHQALCAYKLTFSFTTPAGCLEYLNSRTFTLSSVSFASLAQ